MTEQNEVNIWELSDLCTPWCIHVVATLRIADHIAAGTDQIEALARAAGCDRGVLHAILGHLVSKGLFEEVTPGKFALNESAQVLLDPTVRLSLDLDGFGGRMAHAWSTLLKFTRTGKPAYQELFGLPFWEDLNAHPEIHENFDALIGPAGHGTPNRSSKFAAVGKRCRRWSTWAEVRARCWRRFCACILTSTESWLICLKP